jgi:hypothetical protein
MRFLAAFMLLIGTVPGETEEANSDPALALTLRGTLEICTCGKPQGPPQVALK